MKPFLTYVLLAATATVLVVRFFTIQIKYYHIIAVPFVVFVGLTVITTVDKVFFLNYKRSLNSRADEPIPMTEAELLEKCASSGTETNMLTKNPTVSQNYVLFALWTLLIGLLSALFYSQQLF